MPSPRSTMSMSSPVATDTVSVAPVDTAPAEVAAPAAAGRPSNDEGQDRRGTSSVSVERARARSCRSRPLTTKGLDRKQATVGP